MEPARLCRCKVPIAWSCRFSSPRCGSRSHCSPLARLRLRPPRRAGRQRRQRARSSSRSGSAFSRAARAAMAISAGQGVRDGRSDRLERRSSRALLASTLPVRPATAAEAALAVERLALRLCITVTSTSSTRRAAAPRDDLLERHLPARSSGPELCTSCALLRAASLSMHVEARRAAVTVSARERRVLLVANGSTRRRPTRSA